MTGELQCLELDGRGKDYLVNRLAEDGVLGTLVSEHTSWDAGRVWTWLPYGVDPDRLYRFNEPELLPENTRLRVKRVGTMVPVVSLQSNLVDLIVSTLQKSGPNALCLIEHPMLTPGEGPTYIQDMTVNLQNTVIFYLNKTASREQIELTLDSSINCWRMIGVICDPVTAVVRKSVASISDFAYILRHTVLIFCVGYDGESFIFFDRNV